MTLFGIAALLGAGRRPDAGGLSHGQLRLALDLLHQRPGGRPGPGHRATSCVEDPDYLKQERAELRRQPLNFDYIGLGLLALVMSCWEIMLSKGQEWDWLGDPFWAGADAAGRCLSFGLGCLIFREMRIGNPVVNFRPLGERNFAVSCIIIFCAYGVLYAASTSLPGLLQSLFGYDAYASGLVLSPAGIFSILMMVVVGILLGRGVDARWLIAAGLLIDGGRQLLDGADEPGHQPLAGGLAAGGADRGPVDDLRAAQRGRLHVHSQHLRGAAVGLFALLRNEGGSVGTSMAQTIQERREQFHLSRRERIPRPLQPGRKHASWTRPRPSSSSRPAMRPRRSRWRCRRSTICASSRPRRWPTSTSSGWRRSWAWRWPSWCCL